MVQIWWILASLVALGALVLAGIRLGPHWRRQRQRARLVRARTSFHQRREWLEAKFLKLAAASGLPRGLLWAECDFDDRVAFARDRHSGQLRALVAVTIKFEALEGGGMEHVEAVGNHKAATVVFRLDRGEWQTDGRPIFNLSPAQTIERFQHELEGVE